MNKPDFIFETSWEVCNKIGGIYTVLSTKALSLKKNLGDNYILLGPDVWKETRKNPDFIEDDSLYQLWKENIHDKGIKIRIGRWNIPSRPVVILVDFTPYFTQKDKIFAKYWEDFKLDSISGQWDYIEPALFGYAVGKVIESFYNFHFSAEDKIIAQFHEWMTGSGVLYLNKNVAQIGTIFTTHATVLGRSLAGNGVPVYREMENIDAFKFANQFNILSKFSLERISAKHADSFTTVSEITAAECRHFLNRDPDVLTVNGFDKSIVPKDKLLKERAIASRGKLKRVAEAVLNKRINENPVFILNSGRYEFHNKGIDVFIDALASLNKSKRLNRQIIAYIAIPANHTGPKDQVVRNLKSIDSDINHNAGILTHNIHNSYNDPILRRLEQKALVNRPGDKVKVIYVPAYLNGHDGVFNETYYNLLCGFDLSVFPSYYEPWGYTPQESIAFHVPSITTSLSGFGRWINQHIDFPGLAVNVVERHDENESQVVLSISKLVRNIINLSDSERENEKRTASEISALVTWEKLIKFYFDSYDLALEKALKRYDLYKSKYQHYQFIDYKPQKTDLPNWKKIIVEPVIPEKLEGLREISQNLWWAWNFEAEELFRSMDEETWEQCRQNPIIFLGKLSWDKLKELELNGEFIEKYNRVTNNFKKYVADKHETHENQIAYYSMEFGLHDNLKTYSGGLGILAGDYLKEASDKNVNLIAVSLLYKHGYFQQSLSTFGEQIADYVAQNYTQLPLVPVNDDQGNPVKISIAFPGRNLNARIWRVDVGRIPLYLIDADIEENNPEDRKLTHQLYGGDSEYRLKQELLLGVGGIRLLKALNINPALYHCNEGHSAFIGVERLRRYIQKDKLSFDTALEIVRSTTLFTTHTPVPAGHDVFSEDLLRTYIPHYADRLNISWEQFIDLGRADHKASTNMFSMSNLALNLSQEVNGVSKLHGKVSRELFSHLFPGFFPEEINIGHVTNGVHYQTWTAVELQDFYKDNFDKGFRLNHSNPDFWKKIKQLPAKQIWELRKSLKNKLFDFLRVKIEKDLTMRQENPKVIFETIENLDPEALVIGFARRFATYKRAYLLFSNLERLANVVNKEGNPVLFLFSGKAHPNDKAGQDLIKRIIEISRRSEFIGRIIFLENYDMNIAKMLVQGVDVWLNTPTRPLEASGTSGQKATLNGVLNFSVLDGWYAEGYKKNAGWAIKEERTYNNQQFQDELDAESIVNILEDQIIPLYFKREQDIPEEWVEKIKNSLFEIAPHFTMERMLKDYIRKYYNPLFKRSKELMAGNYKIAEEIACWKALVRKNWDQIEVRSIKIPDFSKHSLKQGEKFLAEISVYTAELNGNDLGVELIVGRKNNNHFESMITSEKLKLIKESKNIAVYKSELVMNNAGYFDCAFRIYASNPVLSNRQDLPLVKWV